MPEWRMAEIVGQRNGFGQIFVGLKRPRDAPGDLRDLQAVGQARAIVIALMVDEDLRLVV